MRGEIFIVTLAKTHHSSHFVMCWERKGGLLSRFYVWAPRWTPSVTALWTAPVGSLGSPALARKAQTSVQQWCPHAREAPPGQALVHPSLNDCSALSGSDFLLTMLPSATWGDELLVWRAFTTPLVMIYPRSMRLQFYVRHDGGERSDEH